MGKAQEEFLRKAAEAAAQAGHIYPEYAACEAALESGWGMSRLATEAKNLFGQKQSHPPMAGTGTLALPTREFLHGTWTTVPAEWVKFDSWTACFAARMSLLERLQHDYPAYAQALHATSGEQFIALVSQHWSTDPGRAGKVLSVFDYHHACFA